MTKDVLKQMLNDVDVGLKNALIRVNELVAENKALKKALAQPEQKPWMYRIWNDKDAQWRLTDDCSWPAEPVYTTPPQRPWVRLTFAEICEAEVVATEGFNNFSELKFARAIDAKLKELNT